MTSIVSDEIQTNTSEDFGFKSLGQSSILPSYNEKLPYASLENLDISNRKSLFVAYSGGRLIIGRLQSLREYLVKKEGGNDDGDGNEIENNGEGNNWGLTTMWSHDIPDVIFCKFDREDKRVILVTQQGQVLAIGLETFDIQELSNLERQIVQVKLAWDSENRDILLILDGDSNLTCLPIIDIVSSSVAQSLCENVASFDFDHGRLLVLNKQSSNAIQIFNTVNLREPLLPNVGFPIPAELASSMEEEGLVPLDIKILSKDQFLLVIGNLLPADETEDISYDQKTYILDYNGGEITQPAEKTEETPSLVFHESFDIAPAYGSVLRFPYFYHVKLHNLLVNVENINIIGSSCASDLTIFDSKEVVQPSQDSERAVLPINQTTDNDTNPIGMALDYSSSGVINEPCSGVDSIERLPLIYVLNNEGMLQVAGLYHESAIKSGQFHVENLGLEYNVESLPPSTDVGGEEPTLDGLDLRDTNSESIEEKEDENENRSFMGVATKQDFGAKEKSPLFSFGQPQENTTNTGNQPAFGQPSFGQFGKTSNELTPQTGSAFGKPVFGALSSNVQTSTASPAFGQQGFTKPEFGKLTSSTQPQTTSSAFGSPTFGKPSFGTPAFGTKSPEVQAQTTTSAFGKPAFGSLTFGQSTPTFGSAFQFDTGTNSGFSKFSNNNESPFAKFTTSGESPFKQTLANTSASPFGSLSFNKESPFAKIKEKEDTSKQTVNVLNTETSTSMKKADETFKEEENMAGFRGGNNPEESPDESYSSSSSSSSLSDTSVTDEEGTKGDSVLSDLQKAPAGQTPSNLPALSPREDKQVDITGKNKESGDEKAKYSPPKSSPTIAALAEKIKRSAQLSSDTAKPATFGVYGKTSPPKSISAGSPFSQYAKLISGPKESPFLSSKNVPNPFVFNKTTDKSEGPAAEHIKFEINAKKDDVTVPETEPQFTVNDKDEVSVADTKAKVKSEEEELGGVKDLDINTRQEEKKDTGIAQQASPVQIGTTEDQSLKTPLEGEKIGLSLKDFKLGQEEKKSGAITPVGETKNKGDVSDNFIPEETPNDKGPVNTEQKLELQEENEGKSTLTKPKSTPDIDTVKSEAVNAEVQTTQPSMADRYTQVPHIPVVDTGVQINPREVCDFEVQSFENDENYLAEMSKPRPLPDYFTHANISKIPYSTSDGTLRAFERTFQLVSAELSVLEDNIKNLDAFFSDQSTIMLDERTERSMCNLYTWRIPESTRLQSILEEKITSIASCDELLCDLDRKVEEFKSSKLSSLDKEVQVIRRAYSELQYLVDDSPDKKRVELSNHQEKLQKKLRAKMSEVNEYVGRIEEMTNILKVYIAKASQAKENQLLHKVASEAPSVNSLLESIKLLQKQVDSLKLNGPLGEAENVGVMVPKGEPESSKVVEVGLRINTMKQLGGFFKNRLGY